MECGIQAALDVQKEVVEQRDSLENLKEDVAELIKKPSEVTDLKPVWDKIQDL